ncbi:winged helix-turn-helix domain-containing protein [Cohnella fermenti]|uniref:Winged helix-turn-helix transcriptional regulator n=1 Tax=Cohnella fermenti TaxID=2565925 RepID=A0A4S4BGR7_9BACL|nr:helix-turn-helix domain-containing protein [Cohnella fermenti]THF72464.1 winged helix-turn-helix transcriptional regulator [Cohnella fermenti]
MDSVWFELLEKWNSNRSSNERQANVHLLYLLRLILERSPSWNASDLDALRYALEQTIDGERPENWSSYNLGMAKSMNYFLQYQTEQKIKEHTLGALPPLERRVIVQLAKTPKSTPTEIAGELGMHNRQQISNLLRSLRAKRLVDYTEIGKRRWYSLTLAGSQAYEQIKGSEQHSAAVADMKSIGLAVDFYSLRKRRPLGNSSVKSSAKYDKNTKQGKTREVLTFLAQSYSAEKVLEASDSDLKYNSDESSFDEKLEHSLPSYLQSSVRLEEELLV